jgi:hypothetical protein
VLGRKHDLVQVGSAAKDVAEEFLQSSDRLRVIGPKLVEEGQPTNRFGGVWLILERHGNPIEEQWCQLQQISGGDLE